MDKILIGTTVMRIAIVTEAGETQNDISDEELGAPISNSEVYLAIKRLKNDKYPGQDGIPAKFFKVASEIFVPYLTLLFFKKAW